MIDDRNEDNILQVSLVNAQLFKAIDMNN